MSKKKVSQAKKGYKPKMVTSEKKILTMPDDDLARHYGDTLRAIRESRSVTQAELARLVGLYPSNISRIERGESLPGWSLCLRLCKALRVTPDSFVPTGVLS